MWAFILFRALIPLDGFHALVPLGGLVRLFSLTISMRLFPAVNFMQVCRRFSLLFQRRGRGGLFKMLKYR